MLVITPNIYKNPYTEKHFTEMINKFDSICTRELNIQYLEIFKETIEKIDSSYNNKLFNKTIQKTLHKELSRRLKFSPCFEIFYRSIIKEICRRFINEPLPHIYSYIDKLTIMSKNNATRNKYVASYNKG